MMKIAIQARDVELTDVLREHVEHRLAFALALDRVRGVVVRLSHASGPAGGINKHCHLRLRLNGLADIVVEETEADFHVAVNRAADRAKRTLVRRLRRVLGSFSEQIL